MRPIIIMRRQPLAPWAVTTPQHATPHTAHPLRRRAPRGRPRGTAAPRRASMRARSPAGHLRAGGAAGLQAGQAAGHHRPGGWSGRPLRCALAETVLGCPSNVGGTAGTAPAAAAANTNRPTKRCTFDSASTALERCRAADGIGRGGRPGPRVTAVHRPADVTWRRSSCATLQLQQVLATLLHDVVRLEGRLETLTPRLLLHLARGACLPVGPAAVGAAPPWCGGRRGSRSGAPGRAAAQCGPRAHAAAPAHLCGTPASSASTSRP